MLRPFPRARCSAERTSTRSTFMVSVLCYLQFRFGRRRRSFCRGVRLCATEPRHVLTEEAPQRRHQLARHLRHQRLAAELSRRIVGPDERDARWAEAEVIFQRLGALRRQGPLDVLAEELHALLAVMDGARHSCSLGVMPAINVTGSPQKMHRPGGGFVNLYLTCRIPGKTRRASPAAPAARGAGGSSPRALSGPGRWRCPRWTARRRP